ncbi:hypothetical protein PFISCL1PPCAC_19074, partial [Pristionchus fissidentatus]
LTMRPLLVVVTFTLLIGYFVDAKLIKTNNFYMYCRQMDGEHTPMTDTNIGFFQMTHSDGKKGFFSKGFGKFRDLISGGGQKLADGKTDNNGKFPNIHVDENQSNTKESDMVIEFDCDAPYRQRCPGVHLSCITGKGRFYIFRMSYDRNAKFLKTGAACTMASFDYVECARDLDGLGKTAMTKKEVCNDETDEVHIKECDYDTIKASNSYTVANTGGSGSNPQSTPDTGSANNTAVFPHALPLTLATVVLARV